MDLFEETVRKEYEPIREKGRLGITKGNKLDPYVLAKHRLGESLKKYQDFSKADRKNLQDEFSGFVDLPVLNLETFAAVLSFLKDFPSPTPDNFVDDIISPYFTRLLPTKNISPQEKKELFIRLKAQFLKYIVAIYTYREKYN